MHEKTRVAIGLGANLARPADTIRNAWRSLGRNGLQDLRLSSLYETHPLGCVPGTPSFVNAAGTAWWDGDAAGLLALCQRVEREFGRPSRHDSREARPIDLDILLWGEECIGGPDLIVPHPRLSERLFVLVPLAELASDWRVPGTGTDVAGLRDALLREDGTGNWGGILPERETGAH
ncbi:MAG: 2-amino-4-hydroxy-6-hydroxymethyldihydropteridine diphosphokinase [Lentisphaeria bacterium]|nr:2-amino-4-hydroxy-6-hydroxymethyldihydropteridine diphosphokinase [Lentisphaeria bacterium]